MKWNDFFQGELTIIFCWHQNLKELGPIFFKFQSNSFLAIRSNKRQETDSVPKDSLLQRLGFESWYDIAGKFSVTKNAGTKISKFWCLETFHGISHNKVCTAFVIIVSRAYKKKINQTSRIHSFRTFIILSWAKSYTGHRQSVPTGEERPGRAKLEAWLIDERARGAIVLGRPLPFLGLPRGQDKGTSCFKIDVNCNFNCNCNCNCNCKSLLSNCYSEHILSFMYKISTRLLITGHLSPWLWLFSFLYLIGCCCNKW